MTNGKLTIEATGIPVVVEITARPGDTLLIVNGVCVGVQSAGGKTKALVSALRTTAPTKHGKAKPGSKDDAIFAVLREHGPQDTAHLLDLLGIDNKSPDRLRFRQRMLRMKADGSIVPIKSDRHKPRPVWEIGKDQT